MGLSRYNQDEDRSSWYGIEDPKKRKQIQDRLAQRARRKRLAAARIEASSPPQWSPNVDEIPTCGTTASSDSGVDVEPPDWSVAPASGHLIVPMTVDQVWMPDPNSSAYAALFRNGQLLGLTCSVCVAQKSRDMPKDVPWSLKPTAKQLLTIHYAWIDRFPFPRMRDHTIELGGIIDDEEFIYDLFTMRSFSVKKHAESWDPTAWSMGKDFAKKWGYLFY